jgi:L-2-hydroxyglutarate oxidase
MTRIHDIVVVGGGIVGLAAARELLERRPGTSLLLIEKESRLAAHQTGRNSGVIHSGVYYPAGSEKARGCREGIGLLRAFCDRHGLKRRRVGKAIVATTEAEFAGLDRLLRQGTEQGIPGLRMVGRYELKEIEPAVEGLRALHLPEVEIVDYGRVADALGAEIKSRGGEIRLNCAFHGASVEAGALRILTSTGDVSARFLVNCAGLRSDLVARACGVEPPVRIVPFRGEYYRLADHVAARVRGLVYPVPDARLPFLGVHLTPMIDGGVSAGPNAVPSFAREGYRWLDVDPVELWRLASYPGYWRMTLSHIGVGISEMAGSLLKPLYAAAVRRFLPDLRAADLLPGVLPGVRAQALDRSGKLLHDFLTVPGPRALHVLNAPSPAATASLAIARRIAELVP